METASSSDKEAATTAAATKTSNTTDFSQRDLSSAAQAPDGRWVLCESLLYWVNIVYR